MTPKGSRDRELVDAVLNGDAASYRELVDRDAGQVIGLCRRILGDSDEAQDVAQDAFVHAYRSLPAFRGDGAFGAWVGRIAARMAVARLATQPANQRLDPQALDHIRGEGSDPEDELLNLEQRWAIRQAVRELPKDQRQVVAMRFYHDMALEEIAAVTGKPLGTVKSRLHRGLRRLKGQIGSRTAS